MRCVLQQRKVFGAVRTLIYYNLVAVIRRILDCNKGCTRRPAEIRIKTVGKFPMIRMADDADAMTAVVVVVATAAAKRAVQTHPPTVSIIATTTAESI